MAEYDKNTVVQTVPTEPEDEPSRNWLRLIGVLIAAIIVTLLVIFAARWIYNAVTDDNSKTDTVTQNTDEDLIPAGPGEQKNQTTPQTGSSSPTSGTQSTPTNTQLPNSGPQHVAAVFAGSSLLSAGFHYLVNRKRNA